MMTQREVAEQISNQELQLKTADFCGDRTEALAAELVLEYFKNVATLYAVPALTLERRLSTLIQERWGNG